MTIFSLLHLSCSAVSECDVFTNDFKNAQHYQNWAHYYLRIKMVYKDWIKLLHLKTLPKKLRNEKKIVQDKLMEVFKCDNNICIMR
jgi:inactivated superfamily I helicase